MSHIVLAGRKHRKSQSKHTRTSVGHRQQKCLVVSLDKVLVLELGAIDGFTARSGSLDYVILMLKEGTEIPISSSKVTTLNHESLDHAVESRSCNSLAYDNHNTGTYLK